MRRLILLAAAGLVALPAAARAEGFGYTPPAPPSVPDPGALLFRLLGLTAGLLALCVLVIWLARRGMRPRLLSSGTGGDRLRHEGTLALDRRSTLHMIRVDGQTVAVTTDGTGLRSIVVLSEPFEEVLDEESLKHAG